MRSLVFLIDEMIKEIPTCEESLISSLRDIQSSQRVRPQEDMIGWSLVSEELQGLHLSKRSPDWHIKLCSIFSCTPIEEIKKSLGITR